MPPARRRSLGSERPPARRAPRETRIDLALQGGGSHGAFTWGVLDSLLEDGRLTPDGVSGTSAGAMNAAVLATGYAQGGAPAARTALAAFWGDVGGAPGCMRHPSVSSGGAMPAWMANRDAWPGYALWESWLQLWSPYQSNPFNLNPLRDIVERHVDLQALRHGPLKLFLTATSVRTGQPRVFQGHDLSVDALMASACLPQSCQAVVIDGEPFWDGGFAGNPSLWPLIYGTATHDLLLVQINPLVREALPTTAVAIADRLNEITFNASLVAEMRAIAFVQKLMREQRVDPSHYKNLRLHRVADEAGLAPFDASSKLNTEPQFLKTLFTLGREAGQRWLASHVGDVGHRGTIDPAEAYLAER